MKQSAVLILASTILTGAVIGCSHSSAAAGDTQKTEFSGAYCAEEEQVQNTLAFRLEPQTNDLIFSFNSYWYNGHSCGIGASTAKRLNASTWLFEMRNMDTSVCYLTIQYNDGNVTLKETKDLSVPAELQNCTDICGANAMIGTIEYPKASYVGPASAELVETLASSNVCVPRNTETPEETPAEE